MIYAVQEVEEEIPDFDTPMPTLIGVSGTSFKENPRNLRAVMFRKKSVQENVEGLSEELYDKFRYPGLSPVVKITFPGQVPLWLPTSNVSIQVRILALIPEARGPLFDLHVASRRTRAPFLMQNFPKNSVFFEKILKSLFLVKNNGSYSDQWIHKTKGQSIGGSTKTIYPPYILVQQESEDDPYPNSLERGPLTYKLYVSLVEDKNYLAISAPGATPSNGTYPIVGIDQKITPTVKQSLAVYRCEESQRRYFNAKNTEFSLDKKNSDGSMYSSFPRVSLGLMKEGTTCSPDFLVYWFIANMKEIADKELFQNISQNSIGFDQARQSIDALCKPASKNTFEVLYEDLIFNKYHHVDLSMFVALGTCTVNGEGRTFAFYFSMVPKEFDISRPLSSFVEDSLEARQSGDVHRFYLSNLNQDGVLKNVRVWNIRFPGYFLKNYPPTEDFVRVKSYYFTYNFPITHSLIHLESPSLSTSTTNMNRFWLAREPTIALSSFLH